MTLDLTFQHIKCSQEWIEKDEGGNWRGAQILYKNSAVLCCCWFSSDDDFCGFGLEDREPNGKKWLKK